MSNDNVLYILCDLRGLLDGNPCPEFWLFPVFPVTGTHRGVFVVDDKKKEQKGRYRKRLLPPVFIMGLWMSG
jgi:hypothetical protein